LLLVGQKPQKPLTVPCQAVKRRRRKTVGRVQEMQMRRGSWGRRGVGLPTQQGAGQHVE
jgi:hypothetical protein